MTEILRQTKRKTGWTFVPLPWCACCGSAVSSWNSRAVSPRRTAANRLGWSDQGNLRPGLPMRCSEPAGWPARAHARHVSNHSWGERIERV